MYDVALNTYGTIDRLGKLLVDNGITDINGLTETSDVMLFDPELIADQNISDEVAQHDIRFVTGIDQGAFLITEDGDFITTEDGKYITVE
jgi:hypothetical protein